MAYFDENGEVICSFCGRPQSQVRRLVAGPDVYICDDCIALCQYILKEGEQTAAPQEDSGKMHLLTPREIDDHIASLVVAQMLFLEAEDPDKDISLYINSPGGSVTAGLAIYDTMQYIKPDVSTICVGMAASMGAFLLSSGAKGKRYALPNAEVMIHQPLGGASGQATDVKIWSEWLSRTKEKLNRILSENTGKPYEQVEKDTDRDNFMYAEEAMAYGLIDKILVR